MSKSPYRGPRKVSLQGDDVRWNIDTVSNNDTIIDAKFEYYELNE